MTEFAQGAMAAFEVGGGQIVEHQTATGELAFSQFLLDARLLWRQPIHGLVEFGLADGIHMEQLAETAVERVGAKTASGGEFRCGVEDSGDDHGDDQIALAAGSGVEDGIELEVAHTAEDGGGVPVGRRTGDEEGLGQGQTGGRQRARQS